MNSFSFPLHRITMYDFRFFSKVRFPNCWRIYHLDFYSLIVVVESRKAFIEMFVNGLNFIDCLFMVIHNASTFK